MAGGHLSRMGALVFFGSLGSESHSWWPIFLYPIIWPWSLLFQVSASVLGDIGDIGYVVAYIVFGTIWIWFLGRLFSLLMTRLFPFRE